MYMHVHAYLSITCMNYVTCLLHKRNIRMTTDMSDKEVYLGMVKYDALICSM